MARTPVSNLASNDDLLQELQAIEGLSVGPAPPAAPAGTQPGAEAPLLVELNALEELEKQLGLESLTAEGATGAKDRAAAVEAGQSSDLDLSEGLEELEDFLISLEK
jgi:hypothetical protein